MIDIKQISEPEAKAIAKSVAKGLDAFYADPENRERFEEWKKKRQKEG
jgi:hypothetical protein